MNIIYMTQDNCVCYAVTHRNNNQFRVQKIENIDDDKKILYEVHPMGIFLGKSKCCMMTAFIGAFDRECFVGNTILLKIGEENNKHRYVYIGGDMVCSFLTNDEIYKYISNMGSNLSPYSNAIGEKIIYYLKPQFKFSKTRILTKMILINYLIVIIFQNVKN